MIAGSMVALVTPMHPGGEIDWPALDRLVSWHIEQGTHAIVAVGTTGESATLDVDEHCAVIRRVIDVAAGRVPVIAGTGANSTREAIELTEAAQGAGADACLLVTPYYNKPTQEGLYLHFKAVAEAVTVPQILYNVPGRTAVDMHNDTVVRLADIPNIIGIKDATGDLTRGRDLIARVAGRLDVFSGDDGTALALMLAGARGNISVTANIMPATMSAACTAALAGDDAQVQALDARMAELHRLLFIESNPIPVKWALKEMGMIAEGIRLPLTPLSPANRDILRAALQRANLV